MPSFNLTSTQRVALLEILFREMVTSIEEQPESSYLLNTSVAGQLFHVFCQPLNSQNTLPPLPRTPAYVTDEVLMDWLKRHALNTRPDPSFFQAMLEFAREMCSGIRTEELEKILTENIKDVLSRYCRESGGQCGHGVRDCNGSCLKCAEMLEELRHVI